MGAPGGEGGELERRNSQEGANYRRPVEQPHQPQHQQPHHIQPSTPGNDFAIRWQDKELLKENREIILCISVHRGRYSAGTLT